MAPSRLVAALMRLAQVGAVEAGLKLEEVEEGKRYSRSEKKS